MSRRAKILDRVIGHLYHAAQKASCRQEHELWSITLRLVSIAKDGAEPTLDQAAFMAIGRSFERWRQGTREREEMMAKELAALVPDYDPTEARRANLEQASRVRRPEPFTGNVYAFEKPPETKSTLKKPVRALPSQSARDGTG